MSKKELKRLCRAQEIIGHAMRAEIDRLRDRLEAYEIERDMEPLDSGWPPCMDVPDDDLTIGEKITAFALPAVLVLAIVWLVVLIATMIAAVI